MENLMGRLEYEEKIASTRDARMQWWREARWGMFIHFGLFSILGRNEWAQVLENIPADEYAKLADRFLPKPGAPREWAKLAKAAGMKYMVLTTRHHEGFSLWDSKANPFNSVRLGPHRDIVREFVDACHEFDLRVGFYSSLVDWHHPDAWKCAVSSEARKRFTDYIEALNTELLTNYGKIDILWYDNAAPMESWEGWNSLERNQHLRALQPDIIINNRSCLDEDFGTPEGKIIAEDRDWEACMCLNDMSWGYLDEQQALPYDLSAAQMIRMLAKSTFGGGNLLMNIGPKPDGSVPADAVEPLIQVGKWLERNGQCTYGKIKPIRGRTMGNGVSMSTRSGDGKTIYLWNWIWPTEGTMGIGGYATAPKRIYILCNGENVEFEHRGQRIILKNLPEKAPDPLGITVLAMEFDQEPEFHPLSYYPQMTGGRDWAGKNKI